MTGSGLRHLACSPAFYGSSLATGDVVPTMALRLQLLFAVAAVARADFAPPAHV